MGRDRQRDDSRIESAARVARLIADRRLRQRQREVDETLSQVRRRLNTAQDDVARRVFVP